MQLSEPNTVAIAEEVSAALSKTKLSEDDSAEFIGTITDLLRDYRSSLGEGAEATYRIRRRLSRVEFAVAIPGERIDPFAVGEHADERNEQRNLSSLSLMQTTTTLSYLYARGRNVISVRSPLAPESSNILKQSMVLAVIAGAVAGVLCLQLPAEANAFVVDELVSPVLKIVLSVLSGVMGPIIFLSLVTAINTLDDVDELNNLGHRIFRRFLLIAVGITAVVIIVAAFLFPVFGESGVTFDPHMIIELLLGIIPTSIVTPFVENNVPQLVELIKSFRPDVVLNLALPYQDLHIMDACLETGVDYVDAANYEPPDVAHFEYSWQWAYRDRFREKGITALLGVALGLILALKK